jgi:hypothetical protein
MSLQNSPSGTPKNLPGTPNVGPGTPNVGPGTPNVGPGTPNVGPGTPNVGPGTPNVGPGTGPGSLPGTPGAPGVGPGTPGTPNKHSRFPVGVKEVKDLTDIRGVLNNPAVFRTTYEKDLKDLTGGYGYVSYRYIIITKMFTSPM